MAFGASIRALLDTYANCVSLLKAFRRSSHEDPDPRLRDHSYLRKALKSDRSLVKRAYSSKLFESGSRFKQGDARAIKALDRILKRLKNAIAGLLRTSDKMDDLNLDYGSLMSLSNASRQDAIKTIDGLSRRLKSPTSASVISSSTVKTSTPNKAQSRRKRKQPPDAGASHSKPKQEARRDKSPSKKSSASAKDSKAASKEHTSKAETEKLRKRAPAPPHPPKPPSTPHKTRPSRAATGVAGGDTHSPTTPKTSKTATEPQNRVSMLSFSSDSTKLGEIPQRKWQRSEMVRYSSTSTDLDDDGGDSTGYGVRPMFPLRPYTVEVKERRFLGWFSSRRRET